MTLQDILEYEITKPENTTHHLHVVFTTLCFPFVNYKPQSFSNKLVLFHADTTASMNLFYWIVYLDSHDIGHRVVYDVSPMEPDGLSHGHWTQMQGDDF